MMYGQACSCALTCRAAINQRPRTYQYTTTRMSSRDDRHTGTSCRVSLSMPSQNIARGSRALDMGRLSYDRTHFLFCLVLFRSRVSFVECRTNRGVLRVVDVCRVERFRILGGAVLQACQEKPLSACSSCDGCELYNGSTNTALRGMLAQPCGPV
jgi:hypothetical protein